MLLRERPYPKIDIEGQQAKISKIYYEPKAQKDEKSKTNYVSITCDGRYLYIFSEVEGLLKIGTGYNYTMQGKKYNHNPEFHNKEKGTIVYVEGKLYYRSKQISPAPLIEVDP
jgi:hypothetical protein